MRPDFRQPMSVAALMEREGCSLFMRFTSDEYTASALGRVRASQLRGASCATSAVRVAADRLLSRDRGFDAAGRQVWGAEKGGHLFRRQAVD